MSAYVDTHCHLDFKSFDEDRDAVLERACEAGIIRILNPGIDIASSRCVVSLVEQYPQVFAAVGVHPNEALTWGSDCLQEIRQLARHEKVVAIGEIGLDYYRERSPKDVQRHIFLEQLKLAGDLGLPVVIHNRDATEDLLSILTDWKSELIHSGSHLAECSGVLHSFSGDQFIAKQAVDLGFFIGFTGPITFRNADQLRQVAATIPVERLLIETDAPFLAPQPKRGSRNEPAYVRYVAEKLAELQGISLEILVEETKKNSETLFKW